MAPDIVRHVKHTPRESLGLKMHYWAVRKNLYLHRSCCLHELAAFCNVYKHLFSSSDRFLVCLSSLEKVFDGEVHLCQGFGLVYYVGDPGLH